MGVKEGLPGASRGLKQGPGQPLPCRFAAGDAEAQPIGAGVEPADENAGRAEAVE